MKANPPMLDVALQLRFFHFTTDESLGVEDCVGRVSVEHIFGRVTDTGLRIRMGWGRKKGGRAYSRSSSEKATHEGVIRWPWSLAIISTRPPRCTLKG